MITVAELKDQTGMVEPRPFLYCGECESECSANKGDYFFLADDEVLTCCGEPMKLCVKRITYQEVDV